MLKNSSGTNFLRNITKIGKLFRYISNAEYYEVFNHLIDKRNNMTKMLIPESKYGGESLVTLILGTNAGRIAAKHIYEIFYKLRVPILFEEIDVETDNYDRRDVILSVLRNKYALNFDIHHTDIKKTEQSQMNDDLNLFAAVIKLFPFPGYNARMKSKNIDIVMLIQNSFGDNTKLEYEPVSGLIETLNVTKQNEIEKLVVYACGYAIKNNRKKITFIHKKINFPISDNIILKCASKMKKLYSEIIIEEMEVDKAACKLMTEPHTFDIICANDRYGTCLASIACGICGGPSLFGCSNIGDNHAVFQPLQNKLSIPLETEELSPYGIITASVHLLLHMDYCKSAEIIWNSLLKTMLIDNCKTIPYGGKFTTEHVIKKVISNLKK